jgi:DNA-binding NarL/FixJ family response regulator
LSTPPQDDVGAPIRVLVADDHNVVRKGLCALLSTPRYHIAVVGEAGDGLEAVEQARILHPDVILMDLVMPVKDGIEAIQDIRSFDPDARILVLTSFDASGLVTSALGAGARGYMLKHATADALVHAIRGVHMGQMQVPLDLAQKAAIDSVTEPPPVLTDREVDVLRCLGRGLTNQGIANVLTISPYTVRAHVRSILAKLSMSNRTQAALYAVESGLVPDSGSQGSTS